MASSAAGGQGGSPQLLHLDGLYREAVELALATQAWLAGTAVEGGGADDPDPAQRLIAAGEVARLVTRVGFCLAWLLVRRAVQTGELDAATAAADPRWRLGGQDVCLAGNAAPAVLATLPPPLAALLARSAGLYRRIERLDRLLAG